MAIITPPDRTRFLKRAGPPPTPPARAVLTNVAGDKGYTNVAGNKTYTVRKTP